MNWRDHVAIEDVAALSHAQILHHRSSGALNAATGVATSFTTSPTWWRWQFGSGRAGRKRPAPRGPAPHLVHRHFDIALCHRAFPTFHFIPLSEGLLRGHARGARGLTDGRNQPARPSAADEAQYREAPTPAQIAEEHCHLARELP